MARYIVTRTLLRTHKSGGVGSTRAIEISKGIDILCLKEKHEFRLSLWNGVLIFPHSSRATHLYSC